MFIRRKLDKFIIPALALAAIAYVSYRPRFHLRPDMPSEFLDTSSASTPAKQVVEAKIARAYWNCVVTDIQWKYGHGFSLPPDPPAEFTVATQDLGTPAEISASRARYWHKLQGVWYLPTIWEKHYEWDFGWMRNPIRSVREAFHDYLQKLLDVL
jgi:hypothetical protein